MTATAPTRPAFLADVIVDLGLATVEQVDEARHRAKHEGRTLSEVLLERGTLGERELAQAVAARHNLPLVDLETLPLDPDAAQLIGRSTARRYAVAPAGFDSDGALLLAMADPTDSLARSDVAVSTRLEVRPVIAPKGQILALIDTLPERRAVRPQSELGEARKTGVGFGAQMWQSDSKAPSGEDSAAVKPVGPEALKGTDRFVHSDEEGGPLRTSDAETRIARLCDQLGERDSQLARLRDEVSNLEAALAESKEQVAELERSGHHRDQALAGLGKQLAEALSKNGSA